MAVLAWSGGEEMSAYTAGSDARRASPASPRQLASAASRRFLIESNGILVVGRAPEQPQGPRVRPSQVGDLPGPDPVRNGAQRHPKLDPRIASCCDVTEHSN